MNGDGSADFDTLLLGLDGVCLSVLEPLFDDGLLPNLERIFDDGVAGPLTSQRPPWTPSAWPSLYTGTNPGRHGAFDFLAFDGYDWDLVNRTHVREHAVWELLDEHDRRSVVVNVPVTAPPPAFDGALVPGYIGPEDPPCHPEGLLSDLRDELGEYQVYKPRGLDRDGRVEWYDRLTRMRGAAFRYLVERYDPDFGFLQFQQTDTVFHELPDDREAVRTVFAAVDEEVGDVLETCEPETVVVVSDHGIGPYEGPCFHVNEFLRDLDMLRTTRGEGGMPSWTTIARGRAGEDERSGGAVQRLVAAASAVGITSQRIGRLLRAVGLREFVLDWVSTDTIRAGTERVDFGESTAYMRSRTEMGVRLNLAGRDPSGTVSPSEYPAIRQDLIDELSAAQTPEGAPVFEEVVPAEEAFDGPHVDVAVDILTVPTDYDVYLSASLHGEQFGELPEGWNHKRDGVIAAAGAGVDTETDADLDSAHLFDVAPTVLSTLGVPPSSRMDGRVLPFAAPVEPESYPPFKPVDPGPSPDRSVTERLADMGYLEDRGDR